MSVRLLKVIVQPVFVADQDGDLTEVPVQPVTLTAKDWKALDPATFADDGAAAVEGQLSE